MWYQFRYFLSICLPLPLQNNTRCFHFQVNDYDDDDDDDDNNNNSGSGGGGGDDDDDKNALFELLVIGQRRVRLWNLSVSQALILNWRLINWLNTIN